MAEMPIRSLLEGDSGVFGPEDIATIAGAFDDILRTLGLIDRDDPAVSMLARLTIEVAKQGERDRTRLCEKVVKMMAK